MSKKLKPTLKNCRSYHSAEIGSDHSIVIANIDVKKSKKYNYTKKRPPRRYDNDKIQNGETSKKFAAELKASCFTYKIIISGIIYLFTNYIYHYINKYYFCFIYL